MSVGESLPGAEPGPRIPFRRLQERVIAPGLCTHCGTCVGLSGGALEFQETDAGPLPVPREGSGPNPSLPAAALDTCPGKGLDYPSLSRFVFGEPPGDWLAGHVKRPYIAYATDSQIRRSGASGGVITQIMLSLLEDGQVDGVVTLRHGEPRPWLSRPVIARSPEAIRAGSQSVYVPVPVNTILDQIDGSSGPLAYVGLPDQVASLRRLQQLGDPRAEMIRFVVGPYVGTSMYSGAIRSFLRAHGIRSLEEVDAIRYREGEWPGHLMVRTKQGRVLRSPKFHYNYLIPFYITRACLLTMDFTNELTDISVGDAWSPEYEARGAGYSVVLARSPQAVELIADLAERGSLHVEQVPLQEALSMHGHMLDFKKRGAYVRAQARRLIGLPAPDFGLRPARVPLSRVAVELIISGLFVVGRTRAARWLIERLPIGLLGPLFDTLRKWWKDLSKPVKRRGLWQQEFLVTSAKDEADEKEPSPGG